MLYQLKQLIPDSWKRPYHWALAHVAAFLYGNPSGKMIVIGVTGTNGKSSTTQFIAQMLESLGKKVGYTGTAGFYINGHVIENKLKMTMPGRFLLQQLMRDMVRAGCEYAVIETTSQGIEQFRHVGINYDIAVFTNLTPEHIESHGSFEAYKRAKGKLFSHVTKMPVKYLEGQRIEKVIVANADDEHAPYYLSFRADRHVTFGWTGPAHDDHLSAYVVSSDSQGALLSVNGQQVQVGLIAQFQQENALAAAAALHAMGYEKKRAIEAMHVLKPLDGRFELVQRGQDFYVIIDYSYEPYGLEALYQSVLKFKPQRLIGVHSSTGGGRDIARRETVGRWAAQREDLVIVTDEDPYDEDPRLIMEMVADGARAEGKVDDEDLFVIEDRMEAIEFAINQAQKGDAVLLTTKGSELVMAVAGGKKIPWSDRAAALKALAKRGFVDRV